MSNLASSSVEASASSSKKEPRYGRFYDCRNAMRGKSQRVKILDRLSLKILPKVNDRERVQEIVQSHRDASKVNSSNSPNIVDYLHKPTIPVSIL
jgi:hypothetical protein